MLFEGVGFPVLGLLCADLVSFGGFVGGGGVRI